MKSRSSRVIAYTRVSTEEQAVSGLGLTDQEAVIRTEAARRGWTDFDVMSDKGFSAKNLARPAISSALDELKRGKASVLVVSKLDRLSRSLLDFALLMETAKKEGWEIVVLDLAIDTTAPSGQLMASVMASFAQYERQIIGQRTAAALQIKKAQGARLGRPRVLSPEVTDRIVAARATSMTLQAIADNLNADAVPTARGGSKWFASSVAQSLKSASLDATSRALTAQRMD